MERAKLYSDDRHDGSNPTKSNDERPTAPSPSGTQPRPTARTKEISQSHLINKLNYLNFLDKPLYVNFRHKQYARFLTIKASPQPCQDNRLTCLWQQDTAGILGRAGTFRFQNIIIPDGRRFLVAEPEVVEISPEAISLLLPEMGKAAEARSTRRHASQGIHVYVTQNGALYYGRMINFSAFSFLIRVNTSPLQTFAWMDVAQPVNVIMFTGRRTLFSGDCEIVKQTGGRQTQDWILKPLRRWIRRFSPKTFRSTRQRMVPLPVVNCIHPLSQKRVQRDVLDLSGSGVSIREERSHAVFLPGLIVPALKIRFGNGASVTCTAQVVYSQPMDEEGEKGMLRCGLAFLDMAADEHVRVLALIQQTSDRNAYLCHRVDLDELWDFFFETGFIYPQKYEFIEKNKDQIKSTYKKLYTQNPSIARHFIHQRNGQIMAHMAMVRFYDNAWLIHHHAAIRSAGNRGGLAVLNQIGSFINDSHRLDSIRMNYVFCYYRPNNKFPSRVFGGAANTIQNPKGCSLDRFAYSHHRLDRAGSLDQPAPWTVSDIARDDLIDLEYHYAETSGGLMIQAINLSADNYDIAATEAAFHRIGLRRSRNLYCLKCNGEVKAVIIIDIADIGLNMSDLTNSAKVLILDSEELTAPIIQNALNSLLERLDIGEMPVLVWPEADATRLKLPAEKSYLLWVLNMDHTDAYFKYLKRLLKFIKH